MGNALGVVEHGCVGLRPGCRSPDECFGCCSHLRRPCHACQAPTHCRQRSWCGRNHKLVAHQLPRIDYGRDKGTYQSCPLALLANWTGIWWRLCPDRCLAIVENVDQLWGNGRPGNRGGTRSAWRTQWRRVVVGGRQKQRTIRAGPNDGLCRPGCKVMER